MNIAQFQQGDNNIFALTGLLNITTVPALWKQSQSLFAGKTPALSIDLENVSESDSAGVALLIAWVRLARTKHKAIRFMHIPTQMLAIMRVSGLDKILPI